jgi:hypothetical protein
MSAFTDARKVAVVGSPSTNDEITVDILAESAHEPLIGQMLFVTHPVTGTDPDPSIEVGLGVITRVTQNNAFHANPNFRSVIKQHGQMTNLTGDAGDSRQATIRLQAAYQKDQAPDGSPTRWRQAGNGLSTAPPTGAAIRKVTNEVLDEIVSDTATDIHYLGHMHGSAVRGGKIRAPFAIPDYAGSEGAFHTGIFGISGSGKSAVSAYLFAGQMRHESQGLLIVDPQGQWASEAGLPFSLQGWASEMGRAVAVKRISEDLRLEKDAPLFCALLAKTKFAQEIKKMSVETAGILLDEVEKILRDTDGWEDMESRPLLEVLLTGLREQDIDANGNVRFKVLRRVYADGNRQADLADSIDEMLGSQKRLGEVLRYFSVIHNLFQPTNPAGGARESLWGTVSAVFKKVPGVPAPMLVLDMSTSDTSWVEQVFADDDQIDALDALSLLDNDDIKAAILRQVGRTLKRAAEAAFRAGGSLNTTIVVDEAWRYLPPTTATVSDEIKGLSQDFGAYARDWRKFGIGLTFITQTTRSINPDVWDQLSVRFIGYGLAGPDIDRIADHLDDREHLRLYKGFAPPKATNPRVYPWLIMGPVSPLSFTKAPIAVAAYTNFDDFRADNDDWISKTRASLGQPVITGTPAQPSAAAQAAAVARITHARRSTAASTTSAKAKEQIETLREHRETGGVDTDLFRDHSTRNSFDPLASLGLDDPADPPTTGPNGRPLDPVTGEEMPF